MTSAFFIGKTPLYRIYAVVFVYTVCTLSDNVALNGLITSDLFGCGLVKFRLSYTKSADSFRGRKSSVDVFDYFIKLFLNKNCFISFLSAFTTAGAVF